MKSNIKSKLSAFISSDKARVVFVIAGLAAILFIFLSSQTSGKDYSNVYLSELDATEYCNELSAQLVSMIENIDGAGSTKVLLTLESSYEYVYLDDDKTLSKIVEPQIRGVAVACTGGENPVVREKVTQMLTTVLSLSAGDISVSKLS